MPLTLSEEQHKSIAKWNELGLKISDDAMKVYVPTWFSNVRSLLKANFKIHSISELTGRLSKDYDTFTTLGSGPSAQAILRAFPKPRQALLCGPTALGACALANVRPTVVCVADSSPLQYRHLKENRLSRSKAFDIVLPITADPSWYDKRSVVERSRLFFYLPYMDFLGSIDVAYNDIMKALVSEVKQWIAMAGHVGSLMLNVADMCCGEDSYKRVYIANECSWEKGKALRAPLRYDLSRYSEEMRRWHNDNLTPENVIDIPYKNVTLQSDLVSISYAVQLFHQISSWQALRPYAKDRYVIIKAAARLYEAANLDLSFSKSVYPCGADYYAPCEEYWAYKAMLGLIELSNKLQNSLRDKLIETILRQWRENPQIQNITSVVPSDFDFIVKSVHQKEPFVKFLFDGKEVEVKEN